MCSCDVKTGVTEWLLCLQTTATIVYERIANRLQLDQIPLYDGNLESISYLSFRRLYPKKARKTNAMTAPVVISSKTTESYFNCAR